MEIHFEYLNQTSVYLVIHKNACQLWFQFEVSSGVTGIYHGTCTFMRLI